MPAKWATWLAKQGDGNPRLEAEPSSNGFTTWDHAKHGIAPWMEFFYDWRFADLFNTGALDMLLTCGAYRQIAYSADGKEKWKYEDPDAGFLDIRLDSNFPVLDIDGDGKTEAVLPRKVNGVLQLCVIDTMTGITRHSTPFPDLKSHPNDLRVSVLAMNARGTPTPHEILVGIDYWVLYLYDSDLNLIWERELHYHPHRNKRHKMMGHTPLVKDIDRDGKDEIIAGSTVLGGDGRVRWVAPDLPAILRDGHVDCPVVLDWKGNGQPSIFFSTGAYNFERKGEFGWNLAWGLAKKSRFDLHPAQSIIHGQAARVARLLPGSGGQQVVLYDNVNRVFRDKPDRVIAIAEGGRVLWEREFFGPNMQEGGFGFWCGDWDGDGLDEVFVNDRDKVNILRGVNAEVMGTLPGHLVYVHDILGDNRAEAIIMDTIGPGQQLLICENNDPHPRGEEPLKSRKVGPTLYNCTRY